MFERLGANDFDLSLPGFRFLGLKFTVDVEKFGVREEIDLKPGGSSIDVTDDNKQEYVE